MTISNTCVSRDKYCIPIRLWQVIAEWHVGKATEANTVVTICITVTQEGGLPKLLIYNFAK